MIKRKESLTRVCNQSNPLCAPMCILIKSKIYGLIHSHSLTHSRTHSLPPGLSELRAERITRAPGPQPVILCDSPGLEVQAWTLVVDRGVSFDSAAKKDADTSVDKRGRSCGFWKVVFGRRVWMEFCNIRSDQLSQARAGQRRYP